METGVSTRDVRSGSSSALCPPAGEQDEELPCWPTPKAPPRTRDSIGRRPVVRSTGNEGRIAGYPLFSFTYAPRRETPRSRVCDVTTRRVWCGCAEYRRSCGRVRGPADMVCVVSTYTIRAAHARALSNFREGPEGSPSRFLRAKSRARKRPSDWIDRNFKYILWPDGSSERPRRRPPAGLWKISSISVVFGVIS